VANTEGNSLYIDLLKRSLVNLIYEDSPLPNFFQAKSLAELDHDDRFDLGKRLRGKDWPSQAYTMIGIVRLNNIQELVEAVLRDNIPGDLLEAGVWRGGATIFMRGLLKAYGAIDRTVWVADSFNWMPRPGANGLSMRSYTSREFHRVLEVLNAQPELFEYINSELMRGTSYEEVRDHFSRFNLLDDQVKFLPGWFHETLPTAPIEALALIRLDADLYDSTYEALRSLYPKLSRGGYIIVDDYNSFMECREAVHTYLRLEGEEPQINRVDDQAVFWRKNLG
jgi:Macrocin-O-methyltransferase (TylF)